MGKRPRQKPGPADQDHGRTEEALFELVDALSKATWWLEKTGSDFLAEYRQVHGITCTRAFMMRDIRKANAAHNEEDESEPDQHERTKDGNTGVSCNELGGNPDQPSRD